MIEMVGPDICLGAQLGSFAPLSSNAILNDGIGAATCTPDLCENDFAVQSKGDMYQAPGETCTASRHVCEETRHVENSRDACLWRHVALDF